MGSRKKLCQALACVGLLGALPLMAADGARAAVSETPSFKSSISPQLVPPSWRGFKRDSTRELAFSPEGPGRSTLSLTCAEHASAIEIRAPALPGANASAAIRLTSGGYVRVFFAKQAGDASGDGLVVARASANDEMLQAFRKSGRIMSGRTALVARTPAEKSAIEDFFAGCA